MSWSHMHSQAIKRHVADLWGIFYLRISPDRMPKGEGNQLRVQGLSVRLSATHFENLSMVGPRIGKLIVYQDGAKAGTQRRTRAFIK